MHSVIVSMPPLLLLLTASNERCKQQLLIGCLSVVRAVVARVWNTDARRRPACAGRPAAKNGSPPPSSTHRPTGWPTFSGRDGGRLGWGMGGPT